MKIGCLVVMEYGHGFLGINCAKGRGRILPGGTYEPLKDKTYQDTAIRECEEETGVTPQSLHYLWSGPDGGDYITFAFRADWWQGEPRGSAEGQPTIVTWEDLFESKFAAYYRILHEVMQQ